MPDERLPQRTLRTAAAVAGLLLLLFLARGQWTAAAGMAVGAAIGLFMLWSLTFLVPRVLRPENEGKAAYMGLFLMVKLPLYAVVLYFAMTSRFISPLAVFGGVALVPVVLVLKVLGHMLVEKTGAPSGDETCRSKPAPSK